MYLYIYIKFMNRVPLHKLQYIIYIYMSGIITGLYYLNLANMLGIFMLVIIIIISHYCERG